jgi:photosystem II stability/assembly factor-like uncharacterized protein
MTRTPSRPLILVLLVALGGLIALFVWPRASGPGPGPGPGPGSTLSHRPQPRASDVGVWGPFGEPGSGGRITGMAVDPADPGRLLVAGDMSGVGLSTDGGRSWQATTGFSSWEMGAFSWDVSDPSEVWVGSLSGPYESTDGGKTWQSMRLGMPTGDYPYSAPTQTVLIDQDNDQNLLAFGGNQRQFVTSSAGVANYGNVYASTNGGNSWSEISNVGANVNILDAVASPNLQTVYVAANGKGILKSTDGGHTWQTIDNGLSNTAATALAINPQDHNTVWAAIAHSNTTTTGLYQPGGIAQTTNGGQSWQATDTGLPQTANASSSYATSMVSILRAGDGTLYTADQGLAGQQRYDSVDNGAHWTQAGGTVNKFFPAAGTPYAWASSTSGNLIIGGTSDSLIASTDHGNTWTDLDNTQTKTGWHGNGFSGLLGTSVTFDTRRPGTILLTAFDAGNVLTSDDGGASWTRATASWDNYGGGSASAAGGSHGRVMYAILGQAGIFNGIAASTDAGATWSVDVGNGLPERYSYAAGQASVAIASDDGATAYAVLPDGSLYETTDTGVDWHQIPLRSSATAVASSLAHRDVYVATLRQILVAHSDDPGALKAIRGSVPDAQQLVATTTGMYAVGPPASPLSGLYRDVSGTWSRISTNRYVSAVAVDPFDPGHVAFVTNDQPYHTTSFATGIWFSCDAGQTFTPDNTGLPMTRIYSVAFDPWERGRVVIGTNGRGFWQTNATRCASRSASASDAQAPSADGVGRTRPSGRLARHARGEQRSHRQSQPATRTGSRARTTPLGDPRERNRPTRSAVRRRS